MISAYQNSEMSWMRFTRQAGAWMPTLPPDQFLCIPSMCPTENRFLLASLLSLLVRVWSSNQGSQHMKPPACSFPGKLHAIWAESQLEADWGAISKDEKFWTLYGYEV